ncbi:MAG: type II toxin-antitoxin system RatA family toxin [Gammaproteobacteria bacterium]
MPGFRRSAMVPYSAGQMYDLVNDVESYPKFLPWCASVRLLSQDASQLKATILLAKAGIKQSLTTLNRLTPPHRIDMDLVEGPFTRLSGVWQFEPLGESACKISLDMEFEFKGGLLNMAFRNVFAGVADSLVDAFCRRAQECYGRN